MQDLYDIFIIGGGINGAGIARDASGRNLKVGLADKGKIGGATSSWSSKLIHGGLRYLENFQFKLVRESLREREIIYRIAPKITKPIPFIIPHTKHLRPSWLIRIGLYIYDNLGGKTKIPKSSSINIKNNFPNILKSQFKKGFQYYDLQVEDQELVKLNVFDAEKRGAKIFENIKVVKAVRKNKIWNIYLENKKIIKSKILINASGPWVNQVISNVINLEIKRSMRLIKGSHIITKKLYNEEIAFTLQNTDKRIVFVMPYKNDFSLIGTTEVEVDNPENLKIEDLEMQYLIDCINLYFLNPISKKDVIETYSGVRPLIEDNKKNTSEITRDYFLSLNSLDDKAPLLNIYGGKITTYRKLAEKALTYLKIYLPKMSGSWTDRNDSNFYN